MLVMPVHYLVCSNQIPWMCISDCFVSYRQTCICRRLPRIVHTWSVQMARGCSRHRRILLSVQQVSADSGCFVAADNACIGVNSVVSVSSDCTITGNLFSVFWSTTCNFLRLPQQIVIQCFFLSVSCSLYQDMEKSWKPHCVYVVPGFLQLGR